MTDLRAEIPFGWKRRNGAFIKDDLEQWVIKRIQDEERSGKSLNEITRDLVKMGIKPRNGGFWFPRRIRKVLAENEKLCGTLIPEPQSQPSAIETAPAIPVFTKTLGRPIRPGAIDYRIRDSCQLSEKCELEAGQRSTEVGKIITSALLLATLEGKRKRRIMEEEIDELQNRDLREGEH